MNATSAVEEEVHRDPGQEPIVLVVGHNGDLNSLSEFLGEGDVRRVQLPNPWSFNARNMVSPQTPPRTAA